MPWHYAFESNVNIGPKPGRTLQQHPPHCCPKATLKLRSFPRPPSTPTSSTTEAASAVQILGFRSAFSRVLPPVPRLVSTHSFKIATLSRHHSTRHPAESPTASRLPTWNHKSQVRWVPVSAFPALLRPHLVSPKGPSARSSSLTEPAPQGVQCPGSRSPLVRPGRNQNRSKRRIIDRAVLKEPKPSQPHTRRTA